MTKKYLNTLTCIPWLGHMEAPLAGRRVIIVNLNIRYKHCVAVVFIHILNFSTVRNSVRWTTKLIQSVKRCGILFITQNNNPFVPYLGILTVHTSIMALLFLGLICWVKFSADNIHVSKYFSYFSQETGTDILLETIWMECQTLFSGFAVAICLCWGFTAQSTQRDHVERCQLT